MANIPDIQRAIGNKISTTLSSSASDSTLSMTVADATGMSTSGGAIILDKDDASKREIVYVESIAGNTLTISTNGRGIAGTTAVSHDSGATVHDIAIATHINAMADTFQVAHEGDGSHSVDSIDTDAIQDDAVTEAKIADDSITNAMLSDTVGQPGGAWTTWTPSYSGITVGDGTVVARYQRVGKTVRFYWSMVCGSSTSIANGHTVSLPVTAATGYGTTNVVSAIGGASANDINGNMFQGWTVITASTTVMGSRWGLGIADGNASNSSSNFPIVEATGDTYVLMGQYEAA